MFQSSTVLVVNVSTELPHAPPLSVATTVTWPASLPVPSTVMRTPGARTSPIWKDWSWRCPCVGSDRLHVAAFPSAVTAGTANVCPVLPGMNAEYMGEKMMGIVGFAHDPGCVLSAPASAGGSVPAASAPGAFAPPSPVVLAPSFESPLEHAAASAAMPAAPTASANATVFRFARPFVICARLGEEKA